MLKVRTISPLLLLALSGCASMLGSAGVNWKQQHPMNLPDYEQAKQDAISSIQYTLKDPDSAKFRNWTPFFKTLYNYGVSSVGNYEPLWTICVEVNAKNSYGGYSGYSWFYVKFRDGKPVQDSLGVGEGEYDCTHGPQDPNRRP